MIAGRAAGRAAAAAVLLLAAVALAAAAAAASSPSSAAAQMEPQKAVYTNQFVIRVRGGERAAREVAQRHGFVYLNHILGDYYHLEHRRLSKRSAHQRDLQALNVSIEDEPQVLLLERQVLKRRVKRDFLHPTAAGSQQPPLMVANKPAGRPRPPQAAATQAAHHYTRPANQAPAVAAAAGPQRRPPQQQHQQEPLDAAQSRPPFALLSPRPPPGPPLPPGVSASLGAPTLTTLQANSSQLGARNASIAARQPAPFNDPSWPLMWYLDGGAKNGFDLNVLAAWRMGYTGKGIVITILDDGLERTHPDLQANYDPLASFDINGDDSDPMPRYDESDSNRHGTRCAGEVAAVPDNHICSIGIAYNSRVGGVRMLDGDVTDAVEARSLALNNQHIHIYSASWGPDDNGRTVDGPGELATRAFIDGVTNGRQGLGSIFVFASGNGGREHDNCNCDGYTNSIWTLSISSATENGQVPWYIEACSSTLATTYSSGSYEERQISTTDIRGACTSGHTGTSASAPLAAGICALVLESNPRLTWRDMQHIVVRTARPANLVARDWRQNGLGRNVSHNFGYGLMDAAAMIRLARRWTSVPVQYTCEVRAPQMEKVMQPIEPKHPITLKLKANCPTVRHLEHVQARVTLTSSRRGDLHIYLISPQGTRSTLLAQRPNDQAEQGFRNWPFMTVHSWGESPNGIWTLEVHNDGKPQSRAHLKDWTLILYGTSEDPNRHLSGGHPAEQQPSRPPPPPVRPPAAPTQAPHLTTTTTPAGKPDFEVVAPPASSTSAPLTTTTSTSTSTTTTSTTTTAAPAHQQPQPPQPPEFPQEGSSASAGKPPVLLLEHNKIDEPPSAPKVSQPALKERPPPPPEEPLASDANQLDSTKQAKDYRSSGHAPATGKSLTASSSSLPPGQASSAASMRASLLLVALLSLLLPLLRQQQPLVRLLL